MTRVFHRGELRSAVLAALSEVEPANGYTIMQALADRIGGTWRPSPGAVYPALLNLQDAGLITGADDGSGSTVYRLTDAGRVASEDQRATVDAVVARAQAAPPARTLRQLLEAFSSSLDGRNRALGPEAAAAVERTLERAGVEINTILKGETSHG